MKPQDVIVALALTGPEPPGTYAALARTCGLSVSESHAAVRRLRDAGLVNHRRQVAVTRVLEFLEHGVRFTFPAAPGGPSLGVPTGAARFPGVSAVPAPEGSGWVWPSVRGTTRGSAIAPLHPRAPELEDARLLDLLAMVDLLRAGRARERSWAAAALRRALAPARPGTGLQAVDPRRPDALEEFFSYERLRRHVRRRLHDRRRSIGPHPVARAVLAVLGDELVSEVRSSVLAGHRPTPAEALEHRKPAGGPRTLVYPCLVDAIAATRVVDELEPWIRAGEDGRTFLPRSAPRSTGAPGDYRGPWFAEWISFQSSLTDAAEEDVGAALRTDIRDFYPSVTHHLARQVLAQRTGAFPEVVDLVMSFLESWPVRRQSRGLPIDDTDLSALVAHGILRNVDAHFADGPDLLYRRFLDDTVLFAPSRRGLDNALHRYRRQLERYELRVHEQKTVIGGVDEVLGHFIDPLHEQIREARQDPDALAAMYSQFANSEHERHRTARRRHVLRLAKRFEHPALLQRGLQALDDPGLRLSALEFLATQRLGGDHVAAFADPGEGWSELERVHLVDALARALLDADAVAFVTDWCVTRASVTESEAEQARIQLLYFKATREVLGGWRPRGGGSPGVIRALLAAAVGREEDLPRSPDVDWTQRLVRRLEQGEFDDARLASVMLDRRRREWRVEPEHLPLLHVLSRHRPDRARPLLVRLQESPDRMLRAHLESMRP